jgi:hypothetical protein
MTTTTTRPPVSEIGQSAYVVENGVIVFGEKQSVDLVDGAYTLVSHGRWSPVFINLAGRAHNLHGYCDPTWSMGFAEHWDGFWTTREESAQWGVE